ncbi:MAG: hypothetical protein GY725_18960 [bacterium]|nr:hypothetical protein [bacterium]
MLEGIEDALQLVLGDADAGIRNSKDDRAVRREASFGQAGVSPRAVDAEGNAPATGELEGVGQEIRHDLAEPLLVGDDAFREVVRHAARELQSLVFGEALEPCLDLSGEPVQTQIRYVDLHLAAFDLRQIQEFIDQPK